MSEQDNAPASAYPIRLDAWRTSDRRLHDDIRAAELHEGHLRKCRLSTQLIHEGKSLAEVLEATGEMQWHEKNRDVLSLITNDVGLIISHWQCQDNPGYRLCRRENSGKFWVSGDSGSWSGYYGNEMSLEDIIYHARDTMDRFKGMLPPVWRRP